MARITQLFSIPSFPIFSSPLSNSCSILESSKSLSLKLKHCQAQLVTKIPPITATPTNQNPSGNGKVQQVQNIKEFDEALGSYYNELVLVGFAPNHGYYTSKIFHFLKELETTCNYNVRILYVVRDGSEKSKELCQREGFSSDAPIFRFYKEMQNVRQVEGLMFEQLICDVSYRTKNHSHIVQLHSKEDFSKLIRDGKLEQKLIVVNISLKLCDPCARVYPTLVQLSKQMYPTVVFARMNGDDSCKELLREMNVHEVPTFLFFKDGNICGRYVGSNRGNLIMEIANHKK